MFRTRSALTRYLQAGAKRVILTVPPKDSLDLTLVLGVNDHLLGPDASLFSNASCTTKLPGPPGQDTQRPLRDPARADDRARLHERPEVGRRSPMPTRAATQNIIPTSTGAAKAVGKVLPELDGRLEGMAMRAPVADGSIVDLVVELSTDVTAEELNQTVRAEASGRYAGIVEYTEAPVVSSDIIGNPHSTIFDSGGADVLDANLVRTWPGTTTSGAIPTGWWIS